MLLSQFAFSSTNLLWIPNLPFGDESSVMIHIYNWINFTFLLNTNRSFTVTNLMAAITTDQTSVYEQLKNQLINVVASVYLRKLPDASDMNEMKITNWELNSLEEKNRLYVDCSAAHRVSSLFFSTTRTADSFIFSLWFKTSCFFDSSYSFNECSILSELVTQYCPNITFQMMLGKSGIFLCTHL